MASCERGKDIVQPDIIQQLVETAAYYSDFPTMEKVVNSLKWDPYGDWQTQEPVVEKPKVKP